jgi:hypothetical protein
LGASGVVAADESVPILLSFNAITLAQPCVECSLATNIAPFWSSAIKPADFVTQLRPKLTMFLYANHVHSVEKAVTK